MEDKEPGGGGVLMASIKLYGVKFYHWKYRSGKSRSAPSP